MYGFVHDMDLKAEAPFDNPPKAESLSLGDSTGTAWIFCIPNRITLSFLPCWLYFVSLFLLLCRIWASYTFAGERWHTYLCQHVMSFFISMIHQREILSHSLWGVYNDGESMQWFLHLSTLCAVQSPLLWHVSIRGPTFHYFFWEWWAVFQSEVFKPWYWTHSQQECLMCITIIKACGVLPLKVSRHKFWLFCFVLLNWLVPSALFLELKVLLQHNGTAAMLPRLVQGKGYKEPDLVPEADPERCDPWLS